MHLVSDSAQAPKSGVASIVLAEAQVVLPLAGLIDVDGERQRLSKQLAAAAARRVEAKLANEAFRANAPREIVAREEERLAAARARLEGLGQRLAELGYHRATGRGRTAGTIKLICQDVFAHQLWRRSWSGTIGYDRFVSGDRTARAWDVGGG